VKKKYFVHESSYIDDNVKIGKNTKIWHFSHIQSNVSIGKNCTIGQNVNIGNNVVIGNNVKIQNNVSIYEGIIIEDFVFCGPSMVFTNVVRPRSKYPQKNSNFYEKTLIRSGATIGANATIVCGNTIGMHSFIGAGSVVIKDTVNYGLYVGNPAHKIGWICECGIRLKKNLTCSDCRRSYFLENNILKLFK